MNKLILTGRFVADPELKNTNNNSSFATGRIAFDSERKDKDGNYPTVFLDIVVFGRNAEYVAKFGRKGLRVELCGRLETRTYQDRSGNDVTKYECAVETIKVITPKSTTDDNTAEETPIVINDYTEPRQPKEPNLNLDALEMPDDDLPF